MDPVASLTRIEQFLLRIGKERGLGPFIVAVTTVSIVLSVITSLVAMFVMGADTAELVATLIVATAVPGVVAPAAASALGRLLLALDRASTELRHLSRIDALTGVLNRRAFAEDAAALLRSPRSGRTLVVAMIDVDDFKGVNDRHGHPVGDAVLVHLAHALGVAAAHGIVGRFGGDEFAVVQLVDPADADVARQAIEAACDLDAVVTGVRASSGVVVEADTTIGLGEAMARADHALYGVKRGRGSRPLASTAG